MVKTVVDDELLFEGLGNEFEVGRYHSWVVELLYQMFLKLLLFDEWPSDVFETQTFDVRGVQFILKAY
jgi:anthranilate synthase component 2